MSHPDYYVVLVDHGKLGREAIVDPEMTWTGALDAVRAAAGDGHPICFVHHIHDGVVEDRTQEALDTVLNHLADYGDPLTYNQREFVEHHFGFEVANSFRRAA
jgi:hypothetical protein